MVESVSPLEINDVKLIQLAQYKDQRGWFEESYHAEKMLQNGLCEAFPQDNVSYSIENTIRGLHIQRNNPQGKLVRCLGGLLHDFIVDLRPHSTTFKKWTAVKLEGGDGKALWVPPGCAHGFIANSPLVIMYYKCSTLHDKESDGGINPFDEELGIKWDRFLTGPAIMSDKDKALPSMANWLSQGV